MIPEIVFLNSSVMILMNVKQESQTKLRPFSVGIRQLNSGC